MKPRTLLILFLLVAGLAAFIYFVERDLPGSEERAEQGKRVVPEFERTDLVALVLEGEESNARLERREEPAPEGEAELAENWVLTAPELLLAADGTPPRVDSFAVDRFLDTLSELSWSRRLDNADRAAIGLDAPRARVALEFADGSARTLDFGAEIPASTTTLVSLAGSDEVLVVDGGIVGDITRRPGSWRDRQLLRLDRGDIDRIALRPSGGDEILLVRQAGDLWQLAAPVQDRADEDKVDALLADLTLMTVESFVDDGSLDEAFVASVGEIEVAIGEAEVERLVIANAGVDFGVEGSDDEGDEQGITLHGVRFGGQTADLRSNLPKVLSRTLDDWRSPTLSRLRPHQVDRLILRQDGEEMELKRSGSDWLRGDEPISYETVSELLAIMTEARGQRFTAPEETAGEPLVEILLAGSAGEETVFFYPPVDASVPTRAEGRDVVLWLEASVLDEVRKGIEEIRKAEPLPAGTKDAVDSNSND